MVQITSYVSDEVQHGQSHSKTSRIFEKNGNNSKRMSDEEKLQIFRERARERVDSIAQAWQYREPRFKEELQVMNNTFQSSRASFHILKKLKSSYEAYTW